MLNVNSEPFSQVIELSPESVFPVLHPTDTIVPKSTGNVSVVVRCVILGSPVQVSEKSKMVRYILRFV